MGLRSSSAAVKGSARYGGTVNLRVGRERPEGDLGGLSGACEKVRPKRPRATNPRPAPDRPSLRYRSLRKACVPAREERGPTRSLPRTRSGDGNCAVLLLRTGSRRNGGVTMARASPVPPFARRSCPRDFSPVLRDPEGRRSLQVAASLPSESTSMAEDQGRFLLRAGPPPGGAATSLITSVVHARTLGAGP